ncbi:MAG: hypothetical protein MUQ10_08305 [Anaerolineae bacterium]|nr:hypothetical protein [Anaerolineae bacterium]
MDFKPDFDTANEHIRAFWARDCIDRCALQVVTRRAEPPPPAPAPLGPDAGAATRKTDVEYVLWQAEQSYLSHHYLAEAVPTYIPGLVCSDTAAYLSNEITINEDTVWFPRTIDDWSAFEPTFDHNNRWWQLTLRMAEAASERAAGRYLVGIPDFQAGIDIVSLLRGPERLCIDLFDNPEAVRAATRFVFDDVYKYCHAEVQSIIRKHSIWTGDWMGLFSSGTHDVVQCDFIALVSSRHFEEFCLPDIAWQCGWLDTAVFHLDGPGAVRHVDALLEIEGLDAIQWVPGAGSPKAVDWLPMLRKIQDGGKSLFVSAPSTDVETILEGLSPAGLIISVEGVFESLEEGQDFVHHVERLCSRRA